jgi:ribosomal protein S18 acetylase RimI-like enzyme
MDIDVVVGAGAASLAEIQAAAAAEPSFRVHVDSREMAPLLAQADLAIGAAGTSSWERCCLGLPTIALVLADNQRLVAQNLERAGAIVVADSPQAIPALLQAVANDQPARLAMIAAAAAIVDGRGTDRICDQMIGATAVKPELLQLRLAKASDRQTLWLWRNDLLMRLMAKSPEPITSSDHSRWFAGVLESGRTTLYIAELSGEPVAMVRFDRENGEALVSINVAPGMRGQGVGTVALMRACDAYERDHAGMALNAEIRHSNTASKLAFRAAGFEEAERRDPELANFIRRVPGSAGASAP